MSSISDDDPARSLARTVRHQLAESSDPQKAVEMQAYMKSTMPFRGVQKPARRRMFRQIFSDFPLPDRESWLAAVSDLWSTAEYREERYAAIDLTGFRLYHLFQDAQSLDLYEEIVVSGAWWDFVDEVAIRRIGPMLRSDRTTMAPIVRSWALDSNMWKRRSAIICQVTAKSETDTSLLEQCIEPNMTHDDFFIRKAIGWALRDYAWINPSWVEKFVDTRSTALSTLSKREALKNVRP